MIKIIKPIIFTLTIIKTNYIAPPTCTNPLLYKRKQKALCKLQRAIPPLKANESVLKSFLIHNKINQFLVVPVPVTFFIDKYTGNAIIHGKTSIFMWLTEQTPTS